MKHWKLTIGREKKQHFINLYFKGKRYRYWNGKSIGVNLSVKHNLELLKSAFELKLMEGWSPEKLAFQSKKEELSIVEILELGLENKTSQGCSQRYLKDIKRVIKLWIEFEETYHYKGLLITQLNKEYLSKFLIRPNWSPKTQRTIKSTLAPLLSRPQLINAIKLHKPMSKLHKPIENISEVLGEIFKFNNNLHLCCLITYGCLLRPHREVRELTWGDFTTDLSHIKLSGSRNKSGRNRIVPVPSFVREILKKSDNNLNIFTGTDKSLNPDYFKTIWSRFKRVSKLIEQDQTLYSFRHSGAIDIFKRTGSITKLQRAMGHSSINVSLTYLRGLEVPELNEEDMPMI